MNAASFFIFGRACRFIKLGVATYNIQNFFVKSTVVVEIGKSDP
jgi:hypothetical protein